MSNYQNPSFCILTLVVENQVGHIGLIWFVNHGGKYYILSEHGEKADWVQNIKENPNVQFSVGEQTVDGISRLIDSILESEVVAQVSRLMQAKDGWTEGLIVELQPNRNLLRY